MRTSTFNTLIGLAIVATIIMLGTPAHNGALRADVTKTPIQGPPAELLGELCERSEANCIDGYNSCKSEKNVCVESGQNNLYNYAKKESTSLWGTCREFSGENNKCYKYPSVECMVVRVYAVFDVIDCAQPHCTYKYYVTQSCIPAGDPG